MQNELKNGDDVEADNLTGIKFIDDLNQSKANNTREEARKLLAKLKDTDGLDDILSEDDLIASDDEEGQERKNVNKEKKRKAEVDL